MDENDVRELKWLIVGAALLSTGATFYTSAGGAPFLGVIGFVGFIAGLLLLVPGLFNM